MAWLRLAFGFATLSLLRRNRVRIDRRDWARIGIVVVAGNAAPALLFAMAEQTIESSVVGMLTAATPLATLVIAVALGNRSLRRVHLVALLIGFVGVFAMSWSNVVGADAGLAGIVYVLIAISGYAITTNLIGPLTERYGPVAVMWRALGLAAVVMTPIGAAGLGDSTFTWTSFGAVAILGIFGTGMARSMYAALISRAVAPMAV